MAFTINRNGEISEAELSFIKKKFNQNTFSRAIYSCVKYVVYTAPELENVLERQNQAIKSASVKYDTLIKEVKHKQGLDANK